jgi:hypothetical protein
MRRGENAPFKTATLTCAMQCAPSPVQRICCFLTMRWLTTWFTADSAMLLLTGSAQTEDQINLAVKAAQGVDGVTSVKNGSTVRSPT